MMNFNEACKYANYISMLINNLQVLIWDEKNFMKITETHLKSKSNPEAIDEELEVENERIFKGKIQDMAFLCYKLINEKLILAMAIEKAKRELVLDWKENGQSLTLDTAIEYNKQIRGLATSYLDRLTKKKPNIVKTTGKAYKINVAGDQVPYSYDKEIIYSLDYNKDTVKDLYKKLLTKADMISTAIEAAQIAPVVDYNPPYDVHDTLEDVIADYEASKAKES